MGIAEFFSCSGLRNYVFATVDLVRQWRGDDGISAGALSSKIFGIAKEYIQIYDAFEAFTTIAAKWKESKEESKMSTYNAWKAMTVVNWTNSVCEGINFLKLRHIIQLSSTGDGVLNWCAWMTGGLGSLLALKHIYEDCMEVEEKFSEIEILYSFYLVSNEISSLALAILSSPIFEKYDVKNAKLYLNTGLVVLRWIDFAFAFYCPEPSS